MFERRIIPVLLIDSGNLVKTTKFKKPDYVGDPLNAALIFNELEVDEILILDIKATKTGLGPDYELIEEVVSHCFMPVTYGGGIKSIVEANQLFHIGVEKILVNSAAIQQPDIVSELVAEFGSQAIVIGVDVKKNRFSDSYTVMTNSGQKNTRIDALEWCKKCQQLGAGEIVVTDTIRENNWNGYNIPLYRYIADELNIPVVANGGAGAVNDIKKLFAESQVSAAAAGSLFTYQKKGFGVQINFHDELRYSNFSES